jgi:hypothetical protein
MRIIRCDRCKKDIVGEMTLVKVGEYEAFKRWELCPSCVALVRALLKGEK